MDGYFDPPGMEKPDFDDAYDLIVTLNMINESLQLMNIIFDTNYDDKSYVEKLRVDWLKIANGTEYENNIKAGDNFLPHFHRTYVHLENPWQRLKNFSLNKCIPIRTIDCHQLQMRRFIPKLVSRRFYITKVYNILHTNHLLFKNNQIPMKII